MIITARGQLAHIGNVIVDAPEALCCGHRVNLLQVCLVLRRGSVLQRPATPKRITIEETRKRHPKLNARYDSYLSIQKVQEVCNGTPPVSSVSKRFRVRGVMLLGEKAVTSCIPLPPPAAIGAGPGALLLMDIGCDVEVAPDEDDTMPGGGPGIPPPLRLPPRPPLTSPMSTFDCGVFDL